MLPITPPPMQGIKVYYENARCYIYNKNANLLAVIGVCVAVVGAILLFVYGRCMLHPHYCPGIHYTKDIIIGCVCIAIGILSSFFIFDKSCIIVSNDNIEFQKRNRLVRSFPKDNLQISIHVELGMEIKDNQFYNIVIKEKEGTETVIFHDLYLNTAHSLKDYLDQLIASS